jgi:hypothetical protein
MLNKWYRSKQDEMKIRKEVHAEVKYDTAVSDIEQTFDNHITNWEKKKVELRNDALQYKAENFNDGYIITRNSLKMVYLNLRDIKIMRLNFRVQKQQAEMTKMRAAFLTGISVVSDNIAEILNGTVKPEDLMVKVKLAEKKTKEAEITQVQINNVIEKTLSQKYASSAKIDDSEIDEMLDAFIGASESASDKAEQELEQLIETKLQDLSKETNPE